MTQVTFDIFTALSLISVILFYMLYKSTKNEKMLLLIGFSSFPMVMFLIGLMFVFIDSGKPLALEVMYILSTLADSFSLFMFDLFELLYKNLLRKLR